MKTTHDNAKLVASQNKARAALREKLNQLAKNPPVVPPPGQSVSFDNALEITLREDKELLERLAQ